MGDLAFLVGTSCAAPLAAAIHDPAGLGLEQLEATPEGGAVGRASMAFCLSPRGEPADLAPAADRDRTKQTAWVIF